MGVTASGKVAMFSVVNMFRIVDGAVAEEWIVLDLMSWMCQIGAMPEPLAE